MRLRTASPVEISHARWTFTLDHRPNASWSLDNCKKLAIGRILNVRVKTKTNPLPHFAFIATLAISLAFAAPARPYSVLTHEELIDLAWNDSIRPLLLTRFPGATEDQLREAHAYAYGGSAIQDMGYYPFGKELFSNLTHYVRSGDFIAWLFRNARTINEYAFAIGALSHYLGDSIGHAQATNPATAVEFPDLKRKFGNAVTYHESPHGHIRTEFAFDIDELTDNAFAPPAYLKFIGLEVPRKFLERAFLNVYGFDLHEIIGRAHPALRSYRSSVRSFIPAFAEAEVVLHRHQFPPHPDSDAHRLFSQRVAQTNYQRHWQHAFKSPGFKAHLLAVLIFIVPKIGAAADLAIKIPDTTTEEWYQASVNHTVDTFREILDTHSADHTAPFNIANVDLDTGKPSARGTYPPTDDAYSAWLAQITSRPHRSFPEAVRQNILRYYAGQSTSAALPAAIAAQLDVLKKMQTINSK